MSFCPPRSYMLREVQDEQFKQTLNSMLRVGRLQNKIFINLMRISEILDIKPTPEELFRLMGHKPLSLSKHYLKDKWALPVDFNKLIVMTKQIKSFELEAKILKEGFGSLEIKKGNSTIYELIVSNRVIQKAKRELKVKSLEGHKIKIVIV